MRYRRSIRIMKGVRLNFSASGASLTVGPRGASINVGPKGTYLNTGIPGTGLYNRTRLDTATGAGGIGTQQSVQRMSITIHRDDLGNFSIRDENGDEITDESLLRKIKRLDAYKAQVAAMSERFATEKNSETSEFVEIYKKSEKVLSAEEVKQNITRQINELPPAQKYKRKQCVIFPPDKIALEADIKAEARRNIKGLFGVKAKRAEYIKKEYTARLKKLTAEYKNAISQFEAEEDKAEQDFNALEIERCSREKDKLNTFLDNFMKGSSVYVEQVLDDFLNALELPVDFSVSYEYGARKGCLKIDLDLPEIEDLPREKAITLASGKVKLKEKTQTEIKEQYLICVTGLAFFFAARFFNISAHVSTVIVSGYTQRINKKTGNIHDEYVYSVVFDRQRFSALNIAQITPYLALDEFEHVIDYTKSFEMKTIEPF